MTLTSPEHARRGAAQGPLFEGPAARILAAGRFLIGSKGADFTTQDLIQEAGVALQTFYRHFGNKDQLLVALIGDLIREHCVNLLALAHSITDPVARLELYVRMTLTPLETADQVTSAQFITSEHWRLQKTYPAAVSAATQPVTELLRAEIEAGATSGSLSPSDPERDAWLMTTMVLGAFHHHAFQPDDPAMATLADDVWSFCLAAVGGQPRTHR